MARRPPDTSALRRGWTTGACATAATKAALTALLDGTFPDPVSIRLPKGEEPVFALATERRGEGWCEAGIVKDAGDDPDVTHGATVRARVALEGTGVTFHAGAGVGTVTKPGLPVAVGEAAVNPVPRRMMREVAEALCARHGIAANVAVTLSVDDGERLARQTWNPRLGIVGGLSILGTTGVVHPFSCAAWIHSIHRGVDVARASGFPLVLASTGSTSEAAARAVHAVEDTAVIDMGDFAGGFLKYVRAHPVPNVVVAGGFAKLSKLALGALDLHSGRSQVGLDTLARWTDAPDAAKLVRRANTAAEALAHAPELASRVAREAHRVGRDVLRDAPVRLEIMVVDRAGTVVARHDG